MYRWPWHLSKIYTQHRLTSDHRLTWPQQLHRWHLRSMVEYKPLISLGIYVSDMKTESMFLRNVTMVYLYTISTWSHPMINIITLIHLAPGVILSSGSVHPWISLSFTPISTLLINTIYQCGGYSSYHDVGCGFWRHLSIQLTHWGRVTYICVGNGTTIISDNGLSSGGRQTFTWTNAVLLSKL